MVVAEREGGGGGGRDPETPTFWDEKINVLPEF